MASGRRLRHRIPVRVRHYWKLLATCAVVGFALAVLFSTVRVAPLVTSSGDRSTDDVTVDIAGTTDLFDASRAHSIKLTFRDDDYQRLLDSFWTEGEKDFLEADLTIDGTTVPSVGIRLKGNSTLQGLTRNGQSRPGGFGGRGGFPGGGAAPGGADPGGGAAPGGADPGGGAAPGGANPGGANPGGGVGPGGGAVPEGGVPEGGFPGGGLPGGGFPGGGRAALEAEKPETLPWLIRFDEYIEGRRYQGHREIAVRVGGMGGGTSVLNEAVSLDVLAAAGEPTQKYAYSSFTVNDRPTNARLIVEHPDKGFAEELGKGVLYKSLAGSQFTDQGDDPTAYEDDFKQINLKGSQDLQPVIDLIAWVNEASDADFDQHLADHVDVASFARYVATQNLLVNFDDMAGPGRNYYLWYDLRTRKFSVVGWDYNLAFSGNATQDPSESSSMGGGLGRMGGHKLKERFLASNAYRDAYHQAYRDLYAKIFGSGAALNAVNALAKVATSVNGADQQSATSDADNLRTLIQERTQFLATTDVVRR